MATDYGKDTGCVTDQPRISITVTNPNLVVGQRIARCWQTQRGELARINGDPNWGEGIAQYVLEEMTPAFIAQAQNRLRAAAVRDPEVDDGEVTMTLDAGGNLTIRGDFVGANGPFSVVAEVDKLTTEIIFTFEP